MLKDGDKLVREYNRRLLEEAVVREINLHKLMVAFTYERYRVDPNSFGKN